MNVTPALGLLALATGALSALVWYAHRAGKMTATAQNQDSVIRNASHEAQRMAAATQAEANKPANKAALMARLEAGDV